MATLYYNAAVNTNWATLGNWWTSDAFTTQASALPTSSDSVVLSAECATNSGSPPTVVNLTVNAARLSIQVTVTDQATFNGSSENAWFVNGNATFNDSSNNFGAVNGNVTFNDNSRSYGVVNGNATFNDSSVNDMATVDGDARFNDTSWTYGGTITGNATFEVSAVPRHLRFGFDNTYNSNSNSIVVVYEKGINGSSILGVV